LLAFSGASSLHMTTTSNYPKTSRNPCTPFSVASCATRNSNIPAQSVGGNRRYLRERGNRRRTPKAEEKYIIYPFVLLHHRLSRIATVAIR